MSIEETTLNAGDMGKVLGISARRVRQLVEEGVFERTARGRYPLSQNVQAYIASIEAGADPEELVRERILLMQSQRKRIEQDLTERQATVAELDSQDQLIDALCFEALTWMRQIPSWLYGELSGRSITVEGMPTEPARSIALQVERWIVGIRSQLETVLKGAAAQARREKRTIVDWTDLRRLSGKPPNDDGKQGNGHA